jgi:hypothetical protein
MPEYTLRRQKKDYQGKQQAPTGRPETNKTDALPEPHLNMQASALSGVYTSQHQSILLFQLPIETRLQVLQHAIGKRTLHIINKYRRLGHAVIDEEYWRQHNAERPSLRASSWMYTYGSLPTTKQLADDNLCDLLVTCRQIYDEAERILYSTNTFAFWDLRTVATFRRCIPSKSWEMVRAVEMYAMFYRSEEDALAIEARSLLQLEAWPEACGAIAMLSNLRSLKIHFANPQYLDKHYLMGQRPDASKAILEFVNEVRDKAKQLEIYVGGKGSKNVEGQGHWRLKGINANLARRLQKELRNQGSTCEWLCN